MPVRITIAQDELQNHPTFKKDIKLFCQNLIAGNDCLILEAKPGYIVPLVMRLEKLTISYGLSAGKEKEEIIPPQ